MEGGAPVVTLYNIPSPHKLSSHFLSVAANFEVRKAPTAGGLFHLPLCFICISLRRWVSGELHPFEDGFFVDGEEVMVTLGKSLFKAFHHCLYGEESTDFQKCAEEHHIVGFA